MSNDIPSKLDSQDLRSRLRYRQYPSQYKHRELRRPKSLLFHDVTSKIDKHTVDNIAGHNDKSLKHEPKVHQKISPPSRLHRSNVLKREAVRRTNKTNNRLIVLLKPTKSKLFTAMAIAIFTTGLLVSWSGWHANKVVQAQAKILTQVANKKSTSSNTALSTVKPSANTIANYAVAPNLPRYLIIPKLGVNARILSVGVNAQGALETPNNIYDTAWYNESASPGQPGAMLIDGHISSWTAHGVFYGLDTLVSGDTIQVERGDGQMFTYSVVKTQIYNSSNVDMTAALTSIDPSKPGLNLISCAGDVIPGTNNFNERIIVFAVEQ